METLSSNQLAGISGGELYAYLYNIGGVTVVSGPFHTEYDGPVHIFPEDDLGDLADHPTLIGLRVTRETIYL